MKTITALVYFYDKPSEFVTRQGENEYEVKNQVNQWVKTLPGYHSHTFEPTKSNEDKTLESLKQIFNMK
jgi:hypothetical protein